MLEDSGESEVENSAEERSVPSGKRPVEEGLGGAGKEKSSAMPASEMVFTKGRAKMSIPREMC